MSECSAPIVPDYGDMKRGRAIMLPVAGIDRQVDELYQLPLEEFTAARNALAKTLSGEHARDVRSLKKPTAVPWAVNQLFWKARPTYDELIKRGHALRTSQIDTLKGRKADVRSATDAHRRALLDAVRKATEIASAAGVNPNAEQLTRMFEAISLSSNASDAAGRFTDLVEPAGFDALAGVTPAKRLIPEPKKPSPSNDAAERKREEQKQRDRE